MSNTIVTENVEQPVTVSYNQELNGIEITFAVKPEEKTRTELKNAGFRWHKVKKLWYAKSTTERLELANRIAAEVAEAEKPLVIPPAKFIDGGGLYDGWKGGNNCTWHTDQELKSFLMADFKRARIPATFKFSRGGYLTSLTVTIKITAEEIASFEAFRKSYKIPASGWIHYTDENYKTCDLFAEKFWAMVVCPDDQLVENVLKTEYDLAIKRMTNYGTPDTDVMTDSAAKKYELAKSIVNSYNRDCSNSMVDYFDRDIYDKYRIKIA